MGVNERFLRKEKYDAYFVIPYYDKISESEKPLYIDVLI